MHFVFYRTSDVFAAEEYLQNNGIDIEIVPTPVQDKAYCGICLKVERSSIDTANHLLAFMEYQIVE